MCPPTAVEPPDDNDAEPENIIELSCVSQSLQISRPKAPETRAGSAIAIIEDPET